MATVAAGDGIPVAILNRNEPAFYCIPAGAYEVLLDRLIPAGKPGSRPGTGNAQQPNERPGQKTPKVNEHHSFQAQRQFQGNPKLSQRPGFTRVYSPAAPGRAHRQGRPHPRPAKREPSR